MTFEEWRRNNRHLWDSPEYSKSDLARAAWAAGYTAARHDILENVKEMNDKLFRKE
jgi:hypothetical protein